MTEGSTNTYVVFVTDPTLEQTVNSFEWTVYEADAQCRQKLEGYPTTTDIGLFEFKPQGLLQIIVSVQILDENGSALRVLEIEQSIKQPNNALEQVLYDSTVQVDEEIIKHRGALGGHPDTSREVINDFKPYIDAAFESVESDFKAPKLLLSAIVYLQALRVPKERTTPFGPADRFRHPELEDAAEELNGELFSSFITDIDNALGVCQIAPQTLAMILTDPNSSPGKTYLEYQDLPEEEDERDRVRETIREEYLGLPLESQIDLFNLLRFPKSNIHMCFMLLTHLKNRDNRYPALKTADLLHSERAIQIIGTEFEIGGVDSAEGDAQANQYGKDVLQTMCSPYLAVDFDALSQVSGKVVEATDPDKPISGARVDLYETFLHITFPELKCFDNQDTSSDYIQLAEGTLLPVLEVKRSDGAGGNDWVRVRVRDDSGKLDSNEGWVVARSGNTAYVRLLSKRTEGVARTDSNGEFSFPATLSQPCKVRTVKQPDGVDGYFDGETDWIDPPQSLWITMEPAKHMVRESTLVDLMADWVGFTYQRPAKVPNGYFVVEATSYTNIEVDGQPRQTTCNTFVSASVVEAWHRAYEADFTWNKSQYHLALLLLPYLDDNVRYEPASIYLEQTL
jgi:hypothetical protein